MGANYYRLTWSNSEGEAVVRLLNHPDRIGMHSFNFDIEELVFETMTKGNYSDYLANTSGIWLFSDKAKNIIEETKAPVDWINWHAVNVIEADKSTSKTYHILVPSERDFLDYEKSQVREISHPESSVRFFSAKWPVIDEAKAFGHRVFVAKHSPTFPIIHISVVEALERAKCTGMSFSKCINPFYRQAN